MITAENPPPSPIAIVGIGLRLPGGCRDGDSYWDLLVNQRDARRPIPSDRFNSQGFYQENGGIGSLSMKHGYFLEEPVDHFDAAFFSMSQAEVARVDPQQRLLLEVMHEALENAGEVNWRGSDVAVYAGSFGQDWLQMQARDPQDGNVYGITGMDDFTLANRVSYELDLHGPSMTVKAGCSSSLIALHLACEALQRGDCTGALVGASNLLLSPEYFMALDNLGALSSAGSSNTFDSSADGYARGDAVNAVYVKRLDHALQDGNPIRAIIRSTAINADGKTVGLTNPSTTSQASLIRRAYEKAGINSPGRTPVVECHGTGTGAGDPLEVGAVVDVFGNNSQQTYIGSVKPNIGHGEGAAGLSSLIKAVLSLERATILPNIKFNDPNPKIPFAEANLIVPTQPIPWPQDRDQRISIDSFGLGGANAHVILESAASLPRANNSFSLSALNETGRKMKTASPLTQSLLVFSAHSETSMATTLANHQAIVESEEANVHNLAFTLGAKRNHQKLRSFCVTDGTSFSPAPTVRSTDMKGKGLLFVFTGQGAQWPGMGRELIRDYPSFREDIRQMDQWIAETIHPPTWRMEELLQNEMPINTAELAQPICTAVQIGLVNLLQIWNIIPDGVVGHSSGEIAAAYAAGALEMKDAFLVAFYRGHASAQQQRKGAMAAVGLGRGEVEGLLSTGTVIACENSPSSVTISGDYDAVEDTLDRVRQYKPEALARKLKVDRAYHSDHMKSVGVVYEALISTIVPTPQQSAIPFFSSVTGEATTDPSSLGPSYWRSNMELPVLFYTAVEHALTKHTQDFGMALEVGPHSALSGPFRQICKELEKAIVYSSCLTRGSDSTTSMLTATGQLYSQGIMPDFDAMNPGGVTMHSLPPYAWTHDASYWNESRISKDFRLRSFPEHELLGARTIGGNDLEPHWRKLLTLKEVPWLADHIVGNDIVFPAAGYITMAGEAIRQIARDDSFTIRSLSIGSAMPLHNGESTEVITRLQPRRLTDNQDSDWFEFTIMSYNTTYKWTRHCVGEIHQGNAMLASSEESPLSSASTKGTRTASVSKWYKAAKDAGLEYAPAFQRLQTLEYNLHPGNVSATILQDAHALLHPTTVDQLLQCCIFGATKGHLRVLSKLTLPVHVDEMYVAASSGSYEELVCETYTDATGAGKLSSHGNIWTPQGSLALQARGINFRVLGNSGNNSADDALRQLHLLEWRPDIDLVDIQSLVHQTDDLSSCLELVERLNILCALETTRILKSHGHNEHHHFNRFKEWNEEYIDGIKEQGSKVVRDTAMLFDMSSEECRKTIKDLTAEAIKTPARHIALAVTRIFDDVEKIFVGAAEPLAILLRDNMLMEIYNFFNMLDTREFFQVLSHSNRKLRIVEIGAGTGGFTSTILPSLTHPETGESLFSTYTYTDISSGFFKAAKERFADYPNIEYTVLDISDDPSPQGLELDSYDIVVAANVLHATPDLLQTMKNCRALLRPGGRLFLLELCAEAKWVNYIMGTLSGWWLGELDGRRNEPYVQADQWNTILQEAGFDHITATEDQVQPFQLDNIITASAKLEPEIATYKSLGLLVKDSSYQSPIARSLISGFEAKGYEVSLCSFSDLPTTPIDVVSLLDVEDESQGFFQKLTDIDLKGLQRLLTHLHDREILWLTGPAQVSAKDPHSGMVLGFARTVRLELDSLFSTMEVEVGDAAVSIAVPAVFSKLKAAKGLVDREYALVDGVVNIPRFSTRSAEQVFEPSNTGHEVHKLCIDKPGLLSNLQWRTASATSQVLSDAEIEVTVRASSVSPQDVQVALGAISTNHGLGRECSGIVTRIGAKASDFQIGDRVLCWTSGALASHVLVSSNNCIKIPANLSFEEAITMPSAYGTALRGLLELSTLETGDFILIHSAAGATGIAAIQVAKTKGAKIFATVATDEEKEFLTNEWSIPHSNIFSSHDSKSFISGIMQATDSRGVEVVLNSLEGELLHSSWSCVAPGGTLIDISGVDASSHGKLDMSMFAGNRGFHGLDISALLSKRPTVARRLFEQTMQLYKDGIIKPIRPIARYDPSEIKQVFQQFQGGRRPIGAACVEFPEDLKLLPSLPQADDVRFKQDKSYVLIGGLGGLGRCAAVWLAERGAGTIIFMSRSAIDERESALIQELNELGTQVQVVTGDVSDEDAVKSLIANAAKPVAGVLHMALVLKDESMLDMTIDSWQGATEAKVHGTWNLHNALQHQEQPIDFFVLFSSIYGIQGNPKQANYAAASTFLDSFVQYRQKLGLPASVVDLGVVEDIGFVSNNTAILENLRRAGAQLIHENEFFGSLQLAIQTSSVSTPAIPTPSSAYINRAQFVIGLGQHAPDARGLGLKNDSASEQFGEAKGTTKDESGGDELHQFMEEARRNPAGAITTDEANVSLFLASQVARCLKTLLIFSDSADLDLERELAELGIDSLIAIELQSWWLQSFASHVTILELTKSASILDLGKLARSRILEGITGQSLAVKATA